MDCIEETVMLYTYSLCCIRSCACCHAMAMVDVYLTSMLSASVTDLACHVLTCVKKPLIYILMSCKIMLYCREQLPWPGVEFLLVSIFMMSACQLLFAIGKIVHVGLTRQLSS